MSRIRTPENMEIAALRKKQQTVFDPMMAGTGTPWEDRGTHGTLGAFIKTCITSLFAPAKLMASIRRPETTNDARGFLIGISAIWGLTALLHMGIKLWLEARQTPVNATLEVDSTNCLIYCVLALVATTVGVFFLFGTYVKIYGRLVAQEKGSPLMSETLLYNVNVYALGPSLLALIPVAGPVIAIAWIFADLVIAGFSRLKLRFPAALIDATLSLLAVLAMMLVVFFLGYFILQHVVGMEAVTITPIKQSSHP